MVMKSKLDQELVNILACPDCRGKIRIIQSKPKKVAEELICVSCKRVFKVKGGVIGMLPKMN